MPMTQKEIEDYRDRIIGHIRDKKETHMKKTVLEVNIQNGQLELYYWDEKPGRAARFTQPISEGGLEVALKRLLQNFLGSRTAKAEKPVPSVGVIAEGIKKKAFASGAICGSATEIVVDIALALKILNRTLQHMGRRMANLEQKDD
jgi:hypothetical protein